MLENTESSWKNGVHFTLFLSLVSSDFILSWLDLTFVTIFVERKTCLHLLDKTRNTTTSMTYLRSIEIKHEYLRSRAYICLSLSSTSSPVISQLWPLSRYSCFHLGSLHPRNFSKENDCGRLEHRYAINLWDKNTTLISHNCLQILSMRDKGQRTHVLLWCLDNF